ncbi:ribonuclease D [Tundrisphaera sp. TA3]|uniref:ribonuclease D n=1 Tax=Tundrisphaera sp. TA3 TaxID=3435775 RepID=UPI003EB9AB01
MAESAPPPLIETPAALRELIAHLREARRFAFDTEFVSEETFEPVLCLVQVATADRLAVVDPIKIGGMGPFWDAVLDPDLDVVMHAGGEDLRICRIQAGAVPRRIFDVQIAAGLVGYGYPLSLGNLVHQALGVTLLGGETRTDWRKRPLTPNQLRYALEDVRHLLDLADLFQRELRRLHREDWVAGEFAGFLHKIDHRGEEDRWRKLSGLHMLDRRGLEIARLLYEWRMEDARRANRPLRYVLRDDLLVAIAKRKPGHPRDLETLRDFNRPHLLSRTHEILDVVAQGQKVLPEHLPETAARHDDRPGQSMVVSLLAATLAQSCAQNHVAVGLTGGASDLKDLIRWHADGQPSDRTPELLQGWRAEVCGKTLLDVLSGRRALRIVDPEAEVPVALDDVDAPASPA